MNVIEKLAWLIFGFNACVACSPAGTSKTPCADGWAFGAAC